VSRTRNWCLFLLAATVLQAAGNSAWKSKLLAEWTDDDARQILTSSPWVASTELKPIPSRSTAARRDSGNWEAGVGQGVGLAGTGILGSRRAIEAIKDARYKPSPGDVTIRWESALPVRTAEAKLGQPPASALHTGGYAIVLYDVPVPGHWKAGRLQSLAYLKRDNKPDVKSTRVEVIRHDEGLATVVYLFPRSAEIGRRDPSVIFVAQIGELFVSQFFYPDEMQVEGNLEL
jgi:hypothetical protein